MTLLSPDGHFLSAHNPLATTVQRDAEARAIRLLNTSEVQRGREQMALRWQTIVARDMTAEARARFDEMVEEFCFSYVLKAVNEDPNHPNVVGMYYCPPHEWFGMKVPGTRGGGGDGPDHHYVLIPLEHGARYEIEGRRFEPVPAEIPLTMIGNPSLTMTLGSLDLLRIKVGDDGTYTVTIGPEPANGNPNHVQTTPGLRWAFIREFRSDWRQIPSALRVRRLDPPRMDPWTDQQVAVRAASLMVEDVGPMYWLMRTYAPMEPNTVSAPFVTGTVGGLVSQTVVFARLRIEDDEAYVFTIGPGGAPYHSIVLHDFWFRTIDYPTRQSCLNNGQSLPNPDGTVSYVVSHEDPGVANWLDPVGLHELLVVNRWQGLPPQPGPAGPPSAAGRLVKLSDLDSAVPPDIPRVTPEQRRAALDDRLATFLLRFRTD